MFAGSITPESEAAAERLAPRLAEACGALNAATAQAVALVGEVLATGAWAGVGIHSPSHWVAWRCGFSSSRAKQVVKMAERLSELPEAAAAVSAGSLSVDQVGVMCRLCPPHADAEVASFARMATVSQLERTLRAYRWSDDEPPRAPEPEKREVSFGPDERGNWRLRGTLPPDEGAVVEKALGLCRDRLRAESDGEPVSWADALVELADASVGSASRLERFRHTVCWHRDGNEPAHDLLSHLGPVVPDWLSRLLTCDAEVVLWFTPKPAAEGPTPEAN